MIVKIKVSLDIEQPGLLQLVLQKGEHICGIFLRIPKEHFVSVKKITTSIAIMLRDLEATATLNPTPIKDYADGFCMGDEVQVFDHHRFSNHPPVFGEIAKFSEASSGVEVKLFNGKNPATGNYKTIWVAPEQLRKGSYISVQQRKDRS